MFVICKNKTIDLSKFETVRYRESLMGSEYGYPVEAIRHESGFLGVTTVTEEIARLKYEMGASALVTSITNAMIAKKDVFYVEEWKNQKEEKKEEENNNEDKSIS